MSLSRALSLIACCCTSSSSAAWDGVLHTHDESKVEHPATIGNGYVAAVVDSRWDQNAAFLAGVFNGPDAAHQDGPQGPISHRAAVPMPLKYGPKGATAGNTGAWLDLQRAVYHRKTAITTGGDGHAFLTQSLFAHRTRRSLMVMESSASWTSGAESISVVFDRPDAANSSAFADFDFESKEEMVDIGGTPTKLLVWTGHTKVTETGADRVRVALVAYAPSTVVLRRGEKHLMLAAYRSSLDCSDPRGEALRDLSEAMLMARSGRRAALIDEHVAAWAELWRSGVSVEGRLDVEQAVKSSTYYILSSLRQDWPYSLSPGGLASNSYNGHTFWDTETWMYPPLLAWYPDLASSILDYRFRRLPGAHAKALSYPEEFSGLAFPWESAFMGVETCPTWAPFGTSEQHISADISIAARLYFYMTDDTAWLRGTAWPLVKGVADFYVSKATEDVNAPGVFHIDHVIPPDELAENTRDSVYTNYAAREALLFAARAASLVGEPANPEWTRVAEGLVLLYDEATHRHPEYAGYTWGTQIKQADVVLLPYPLGMEMDRRTRIEDLKYYASVTDPGGPAMTWGMHCLGFLQAGLDEEAASNFNRSFANVKQPFLVWTEYPTGGAVNFITGAGGFLQTVIFGYFGVRMDGEALEMRPRLMEGASSAELRGLAYVGRTISARCSRDGCEFSMGKGLPLQVASESVVATLSTAAPVSFPLGAKISIFPPPLSAADFGALTKSFLAVARPASIFE